MKHRELRICFYLLLAVTVTAQWFGSTGLTTTPLKELQGVLFSGHSVFLIGGITLHTFLMKLFSPADRRELAVILSATLAFTLVYLGARDITGLPYWYILSIPEAGLGVASLGVILYQSFSRDRDTAGLNRDLLVGSACIYLVALNIDCYLDLTSAIHPVVYDPAAYKFDLSLGADFSAYMAALMNAVPVLGWLASSAYFILPYGFSVLFGLYVAAPGRAPANILAVIFTSMFFAFLFYHLAPAAGPRYAFSDLFPLDMPPAEQLRFGAGFILPAPRNAIPSMHFGWAFIMWLISLNYRMPVKLAYSLLMLLMVIATLGLGEHYLIDLFMAVPFMLFVFSFSRKPLLAGDGNRTAAFIAGMMLTVFWSLYLRTGHQFFAAVPGLSWILVLATLFICYRLFPPVLAAGGTYGEYRSNLAGREGAVPGPPLATLLVCLVFFFSGFAALVYQVVFSKILSYTFGSNSSAVYTVLATYMGGMALGAWLGGRIAQIRKPPLRIYAVIELLIALYCLLSPFLFRLVQAVYTHIGAGMLPGQASLDILRFMLGVLVLLLPTVLMGMSLPVLIAHFRIRKQTYGNSIALLYSTNTLGAALGALISGYFIIPAVGIKITIFAAAWLNLLSAGIAYIYANKHRYIPDLEDGTPARAVLSGGFGKPAWLRAGSGHIALFAIGFISLGLEVVYVHMLAIVAGNSVYAFSLMLFTFLLGLGAGSELARQIMARYAGTAFLVGLSAVSLAVVILGGVFLWDAIPGYFAGFEHYPSAKSFAEREFIRGLVCFVSMFPPALIIGFLYPACLQHVSETARGIRIRALSAGIALNTVGNILGVLVVGFLLLPRLGALATIQTLAVLAGLISLYFMVFIDRRQKAVTGGLVAGGILLLAGIPHTFNYDKLATGANVYFRSQNFGHVIDHLESLDGGLTTVHNFRVSGDKTIRTLLTNGKFQGTDDRKGELVPQFSYGLVPLLHTPARDRALVIGYGTGATTATLYEAGFGNLDVVDISGDIFTLANRYFSSINDRVTEKTGVNKFVTDGRNYLLLTENRYDLISIQITSIWFAGAASLYNREFYELVNSRLKPGGILQQWVQLHHIRPYDLFYIIGTLRSEFRYVWLYVVGEQGILVAGNSTESFPSRPYIRKVDRTIDAYRLVDVEVASARQLLGDQLLRPAGVDRMVKSFVDDFGEPPVSTNNNSILEYSTPRGNALDATGSYVRNIEMLKSYGAP